MIFSRTFLRNYFIFVLLVSIAQFLLLFFFYQINWGPALVDSLFSNILLFVLLLSLWFVVRFARSESVISASSIRNSVIAGLLLVSLWMYINYNVLDILFANDTVYIEFFRESVIIRLIAGLFSAGLIYLTIFLIVYQESIAESLKRENELRLLIQKTELQALKNQLNPHFIYNSLNSISALTLYSPEKAREMVVMLSDFLRIALRQDATQKSSLEEELKNIELYLSIEKIRFEEKLEWEFKVAKEHYKFQVPVLILQPIFENAVKHGIQNSSVPGKIILISEEKESKIELRIQNTFDVDFQRFKGEGVGLENIRNRIRIIYGNAGSLRISSRDNKFEVLLSLPVL